MGPTPLLPATWAANSCSTVSPNGVMTPMPVMTTRLRTVLSPPPGADATGLAPLLPPPHDHRAALPHLRQGGLQHVRPGDRLGPAQHDDGAFRIGFLVPQRRRHDAVFERQEADGQLRRAPAGAE